MAPPPFELGREGRAAAGAADLPQLFAPPPKRALPVPPPGHIEPPPPATVHVPLAGGRGAYVAFMAGARMVPTGPWLAAAGAHLCGRLPIGRSRQDAGRAATEPVLGLSLANPQALA